MSYSGLHSTLALSCLIAAAQPMFIKWIKKGSHSIGNKAEMRREMGCLR